MLQSASSHVGLLNRQLDNCAFALYFYPAVPLRNILKAKIRLSLQVFHGLLRNCICLLLWGSHGTGWNWAPDSKVASFFRLLQKQLNNLEQKLNKKENACELPSCTDQRTTLVLMPGKRILTRLCSRISLLRMLNINGYLVSLCQRSRGLTTDRWRLYTEDTRSPSVWREHVRTRHCDVFMLAWLHDVSLADSLQHADGRWRHTTGGQWNITRRPLALEFSSFLIGRCRSQRTGWWSRAVRLRGE
jgi:hypothetical protein